MADGRVSEACPKFQESQRLDPGGGTLLNLAVCHEREGKTATAWAEFGEAVSMAKRDARPDRLKIAKEHMAALEPKLSRVTVTLASGAEVNGLRVEVNGMALRSASMGMGVPVDPGTVKIVAKAPGRKTWSTEVTVGGDSDAKSVKIPVLAEGEGEIAGEGSAGATESAVDEGDDGSTKRTWAYVAGGVGLAAIGVGSYFGVRAFSKRSASNDECVDECTPRGVELNDEAKTAALGANIGFGVGLVALGAATYLFVTSGGEATGREGASEAHVRVAPSVGTGGGGVQLSGVF